MTKILKDVSKYTKAKLNNPNMIEDIKKLEIGCIKTPLYILGVKKKNIIIS